MSRKASSLSLSASLNEGMSPLMILQKIQLASEAILKVGEGEKCRLLLWGLQVVISGLRWRTRVGEDLLSVRATLGRYINVER